MSLSLFLSPVDPAWLHPHAQPSLRVVKIILIYNGSHYKHVRKQHHGDGAQTKSQCKTVFIRPALCAKSRVQLCVCVSLLMWLKARAVRRSLDWHFCKTCAFMQVCVYGERVCGFACTCVCVKAWLAVLWAHHKQ